MSSKVAVMKRRRECFHELSPEFMGVGIGEYVEDLSKKSTSEVK